VNIEGRVYNSGFDGVLLIFLSKVISILTLTIS